MAATLNVDIIVNAAKAALGFKKVEDQATQTATKVSSTGSKLASLGKSIATGFAVAKVVDFGREAAAAAQAAQVENAKLASVMKDAGDTTGEATKHAIEYADSLGRQIGVSPEVIKSGESILATFHSVSDQAGRTSGIFDRTTAAAADLAAAGFGTIQTNSVQLGKALEDPTKGLTSLTRVGVTFTAQQKAAIALDLKRHDTLAAQKVILGGVEDQVKGTAAATATSGAKMSVAMDEAKVTIGTKLLPIINDVKADLLDLINFVTANSGWLGPLVLAVGGAAAAIVALNLGVKIYRAAADAAKVATVLWSGVTKIATAANWLLDAALDADPLVLIALAVLAVIAVLVILVIKVKVVRDAFVDAFNWIARNWPLLLAIIAGPIGLAVLIVVRNFATIKAFAIDAWHAVSSGVVTAVNIVVGFFVRLPGQVAGALADLFHIIISPFQDAWHWIDTNVVQPMENAFNGLGGIFSRAVGGIKAIWNPIADGFNAIHISLHVPSNPLTKLAHIDGLGFDWRPPIRLPRLATGGVFDRATAAIVGESGREIVAPEALLRQIVAQGGSTVTINVNVPPTVNPAEVGRQVVTSLRAYVRANGPIPGIAV